MDTETLEILCAAEEAVGKLVEECRRGRLSRRHPRAVAQLCRTGKWHLAAIAAFHRTLDDGGDDGGEAA